MEAFKALLFPSAVAQQTIHFGGHFLTFFNLSGVDSDSSIEGYIFSFALDPFEVTFQSLYLHNFFEILGDGTAIESFFFIYWSRNKEIEFYFMYWIDIIE